MIKNDTDFWNWYCARLLDDEKFIRDIVARKSFSKLRSSLAALYAARGKPREAEAAFRQAVSLYDLSPEANYRLANLLSRQGRFDEALEIFDKFVEKDPNNEQAKMARKEILHRKAARRQMDALEKQLKEGTLDFNESMELCSIYLSLGQIRKADALMLRILEYDAISPEQLMQTVQLAITKNRYGVIEKYLHKYVSLRPNEPNGWINLAAFQLALNKRGEMWVSLQKAIDVGGPSTRNVLLQDKRFDAVRNTEQFRNMLPAQPGKVDIGILPGY